MRALLVPLALLAPLAVALATQSAPPSQPEAVARAAQLGALPLHFEPNWGQDPQAVEFAARGPGYAILLEPGGAVLALPCDERLRMRFVAAQEPRAEALEPLPGVVHVFRGNDPSAWRAGIPTFARVRYAGVWPGIDVVHYGRGRSLEYDFVVAPSADPGRIRVAWEGARRLELEGGDLLVHTVHGIVRQRAPVSYQERGGAREAVASRYVVDGDTVRIELGPYDREREVVVDPVVDYGTYLGGGSLDHGFDVDADADGNLYLTGSTQSNDFPLANPFQATYAGQHGDVFVSKISADGQTLLYCTYVGGSVGDIGYGIAVDATGSAYVTGTTGGSIAFNDFPVVNALQPTYGGTDDAILFKLSPDGGQLLFSTYLGGGDTDILRELELAPDGTIVVAGNGGDGWPTTPGAPASPAAAAGSRPRSGRSNPAPTATGTRTWPCCPTT